MWKKPAEDIEQMNLSKVDCYKTSHIPMESAEQYEADKKDERMNRNENKQNERK